MCPHFLWWGHKWGHKKQILTKNTKNMITQRIIFDHRGRTKKGKEGPVEIILTYNRKKYYINTGVRVRGNELFNGQIINRTDAVELQARLDFFSKKIMQAVNHCIEEGCEIDVAQIRRKVYAVKQSSGSLLQWMEEQIPVLPINEGTRRRYTVTLRRLRQYNQMTKWSDLTVENLYKWDTWLHHLTKAQSNGDKQAEREQQPIGDAAVYNYHRTLRSMLTRAVKFQIIDVNPYDSVRGEFRKGIRENVEYLTEEEITAIESLQPIEGTQMAMARDLFVFQLYTGLSYADTQSFDISNYKYIQGKWLSVGERVKTGVPYVSQLLPQAVEVLERYGMRPPIVNNSQYNESLKVIQSALGITTRLHSHLARHTFATRALRMGVKIENVSRMLGHTNITQTQRYAKVLAESVHEDFSKMAAILQQHKNKKL